ncbi:serine/threonine-protein kinase HAL4/sat4 [Mortierella sp. AD094]|nr:serine/threonine-protein kinase HAL4/sat4 [Mortierella sp. AD094]
MNNTQQQQLPPHPTTPIQGASEINSMEALPLDSPQGNKVLSQSDNNTGTEVSNITTPLTSEALAAQDSLYTNKTRIDTAAAPAAANPDGHPPEIQLREPSPLPASLPDKDQSPPRPRAPSNRSRMLAEIPSAYDLYSGASDGKRSATPSVKSLSAGYSSDNTAPSSGRSSGKESKVRFEKLPNGGHRHNLSAPKRHQYLTKQVRRLRELLEGKKDKEGKKDGHGHEHEHEHGHAINPDVFNHPLSLLNEKIKEFEGDHLYHHSLSSKKKHSLRDEFMEKYGDLQQVVGKGAFGTVRLSIKKDPATGGEVVFAIKEFKHNNDESQKSYMRRLTSEFCIASSLKHINVIQTLDLLQLHGDSYSEVMEYCPGGDMHTLIASAGTLGEAESGCFFAQLINGVAFLHSIGVVHRDLKPENLLITADGCIKIADFGNSEVFRMPWEKKVRPSASIRGSGPFIAPEEFTSKVFDGRKVDMWSCGIIYLCMRLGRYTWAEASKGDPNWESFLYKIERWTQMREALPESRPSEDKPDSHYQTHPPKFTNLAAIEETIHVSLNWPEHISEVINYLMDPNPKDRWQAGRALDSDWLQNVDICHPSERPAAQNLDESDFHPTPSQRVGSKVLEETSDVTGCKVASEVKSHRAIETAAPKNNKIAL